MITTTLHVMVVVVFYGAVPMQTKVQIPPIEYASPDLCMTAVDEATKIMSEHVRQMSEQNSLPATMFLAIGCKQGVEQVRI